MSTLLKSEAKGGVYRYADGTAGDALAILHAAGMNYARLKVWVNPADGYNTKEKVATVARRVKARHGAADRLPLQRPLGRPRPAEQTRRRTCAM